MRVTLIEPRAPGRHVYSNVKMPRLGLPLLGTMLRSLGHKVRVLFATVSEIKVADLADADVVGISATTSTSLEAYHLARFARSLGKTVVMGGPHVTFLPDEALEHCDYVVRGEAETTFGPLLECIRKQQSPADMNGISYREQGRIVHNPPADWIHPDAHPRPDLSLISGYKASTYPVMTSRGCPFDCSFCSVTSMFGRKFRCRDTELVLEELRHYKGKNVFFIDDNFTANPARSKALLREMIQRQDGPASWYAQVRTDAARDPELLDLMRRSGCSMVFIGMESVNPETLARFNKRQGVEDIEYAVRAFHKYGILVHGMFVLGSDDDTVTTVRETADFAIRNRIDSIQFLVLTPLPGTRDYEELDRTGRLLTKDWSLYDGHHVVYQPARMSALELQVETIRAMKKFYSARRITENFMITGKASATFRAIGYWGVRKWEKDNLWFNEYLRGLTAPAAVQMLPARLRLAKSIETFKMKHFRYVSFERLMDLEIFEDNGGLMVNLKGYLNGFTLSETFRTLRGCLPSCSLDLTINIEQVSFASEEALKKFIVKMNQLASQARSVQIKFPHQPNLGAKLQSALEKYNCPVPRFEF
ncbi:MAG: B12-binding domain-containing radical SAM protein [Solirubrobacterales bacterium]